ncbi:MAG TPA: methionyl-tRNA formyltransferase [Candidatus Edwardsbacteria bacterium]|nr:methionyl-tRNA formyltransferase [Candidatus Edwardsbacteria bacterium]
MRIVFMGTPQFAVPTLDALQQAGHDIAAVFTQPDRPAGRSGAPQAPPVKDRALEHGCAVHQPQHLRSADIERTLRELSPELLVVVAYGLKLPPRILGIPPRGAVNLHPSLLPKYRGAAPVNWALINSDPTTGISTMFMADAMDAGDVILQQEVALLPDETAGDLEQRLSRLGAALVVTTVDLIAAGNAPRTPQDAALATLAPKLKPEDGRIDWRSTSQRIRDLVRGTTPRPGAFTIFRGQRLEIAALSVLPGTATTGTKDTAGAIAALDRKLGPVVGTADGAVAITSLKPAGKRAMTGNEFLNGYRPAIGERLG